jgi:DNA-binding transcriptional ArsR family regulator
LATIAIVVTDRPAELGPVLRALADPARLGVVEVLSEGPRRAGELAEACGISAPTMSKHLRVLLRAGIVADERSPDDARLRVFRLRTDSVVALRAWLDQVQARWDDQLRSFKRHVEESR